MGDLSPLTITMKNRSEEENATPSSAVLLIGYWFQITTNMKKLMEYLFSHM